MNKKVAEAYIKKSGIFLGKCGGELNKEAVELISGMATFLNDTLTGVNLNSKNSGIPPSQDQNRDDRGSKKEKSGNKPGAKKVTRAIPLEKLRTLIRLSIYQLICLNSLLVIIRILDMSQDKK